MPKRLVLHNSMVHCVLVHGKGEGYGIGSVFLLLFLIYHFGPLLSFRLHLLLTFGLLICPLGIVLHLRADS